MAQAKNFPRLEPKKYAIALCSRNVWGVITSDGKRDIEFADGSSSSCYTGFACRGTVLAGWGIHEGKTFVKEQGEPWASRNPHVVAYLYEMSDDTPIEDILEFARSKLSAMNL